MHKMPDGPQAVTRNYYLPSHTIQTGVGDIEVPVPYVRNPGGSATKFNCNLLLPYLKRAKSMGGLIPGLYIRAVSSGNVQGVLAALASNLDKCFSANTVSRLKARWQNKHRISGVRT